MTAFRASQVGHTPPTENLNVGGFLGFHRFCQLFPLHDDTVVELAENMVACGWAERSVVTVFEGQILDGRHRYLAAKMANAPIGRPSKKERLPDTFTSAERFGEIGFVYLNKQKTNPKTSAANAA